MGIRKELFSFTRDAITLGSSRARVVVFSFFLIILTILPTEKLGPVGGICIFKNFIFPLLFGQRYNCPGCGITHAVSAVMHGNMVDAYNYNKLIIVVFPLIVLIISFDLINWIKTRKTG
ncbi:MAG: DUF2752 domain-containing protein [Patescibacteria group bacterium]